MTILLPLDMILIVHYNIYWLDIAMVHGEQFTTSILTKDLGQKCKLIETIFFCEAGEFSILYTLELISDALLKEICSSDRS